MLEVNGNLWDYHARGFHVVVTTNAGWEQDPLWAPGASPTLANESGPACWNNMGAGSVYEAWRRNPSLAEWYGRRCRAHALQSDDPMPVLKRDDLRLVFLPVKPLLRHEPAMSWNQKASLLLIESGLRQIERWYRGTFGQRQAPKLAMTLPGAGNGGLDPREVRALVVRELGHTGVTLVDRQLQARQLQEVVR